MFAYFRIIRVIAVIAICHCAVTHTVQLTGKVTVSKTTIAATPSTLQTRQSTFPHNELVSIPAEPAVCTEAMNNTNPLGRLRNALRNTTLTQLQQHAIFDAFLVFYTDEHLSEEPAPEERRLQYISGWDGPGKAAVMAEGGAAIWVNSGDVRRARHSLSCAWLVLDGDDPSQPSIAEWIAERLGRNGRVGGDARLASIDEWHYLTEALIAVGLQLIHVPTLIDQLWNEEPDPALMRPEFSRVVAKLHSESYTGKTWRDKVNMVREELRAMNADAMIVTALDEVSWLLNVRGRDLPYAPLLKAFVVVSLRDVKVYAPPGKLSMPVREALAVYNCYGNNNNCTRVNDYTAIYTDLRRSTEWNKILIPVAGTFQRGASAAIQQSIPQIKRLLDLSPIIAFKSKKNNAESNGMKRAHLRDAVAMCTVFDYLERNIKHGLYEMAIADKVASTIGTQANYVSLSMRTKVAFGNHGVDPDYIATNATSRRVFTNSTLIVQSGGQYEEGTTLITRSLHYGKPSLEERRAYTTTLRSLAALAMLNTPERMPAAHADSVARAPLWAARQDYPNPTGHGVGAALTRCEDPVVVDYRQDTNLHTLRDGYFITSEPAWYDPSNKFGVRLGNILEVVAKPNGFLTFMETTLVPFEPKLIEKSMLTDYEINWLNEYNSRIRKIVGPELRSQGLYDPYYWMMNRTIHIEPHSRVVRCTNNSANLRYGLGFHQQLLIAFVIFTLLEFKI